MLGTESSFRSFDIVVGLADTEVRQSAAMRLAAAKALIISSDQQPEMAGLAFCPLDPLAEHPTAVNGPNMFESMR